MRKVFEINIKVDTPILIGQDSATGRRQLIPIISGELSGTDLNGNPMAGTVLPGGVDSQIIRPSGICELSARYGIRLTTGETVYIENNGIRTVPEEYKNQVLAGEFVDPDLYYFCTTPKFEVYSGQLGWLTEFVFICKAKRFPDAVLLSFYAVE